VQKVGSVALTEKMHAKDEQIHHLLKLVD